MAENSNLIVSALLQTDPDLAASIDGSNSWKAAIIQRGARVHLYRDYERGDHRADMTTQMKAMLRLKEDAAGINDFNDNYCRIVIDKMAGRVSVAEIGLDDKNAEKNWLEPLLNKQDFQAAEQMWWRGAIRDGDAFVMIDPVTLLWSSEPAYDGFSGMVAIYNQMTRKPVWACKVWSESDTSDRTEKDSGSVLVIHLIVYQPERISYWQGSDGGGEVTPMPQEVNQPDGSTKEVSERSWPAELEGALPFVSFANNRDNYTRYGDSEIRPAIPPQDVLNRTMYSMVMASEFAAFPVNWAKGMAINPGGIVPGGIINLTLNDVHGVPLSEFTAEQIAYMQASSVGQFQAADISQYTNQIETIVREISQATQTPIYGITAQGAISGDALKQLEIGLIGKVERFQRQNKDALQELIILTAKMERLFLPGLGTPEIEDVHITWKSPELLDSNLAIQSLIAMRKDADGLWADSFYQQKIGQLLGMSKDDIQKEIDAAETEKQSKLDAMKALQPPSLFGGNEQPNPAQPNAPQPAPVGVPAPPNAQPQQTGGKNAAQKGPQ